MSTKLYTTENIKPELQNLQGLINSSIPVSVVKEYNETSLPIAEPVTRNRLKYKWLKAAADNIAPAYKVQDKEKLPLVRNKLINRAYADIYFSDPTVFKWAGLAVFASYSVAKKMVWLRNFNQASKASLLASFGTALPLYYAISQFDYLYEKVGLGNKMIYADIYWQHLAYRENGIKELENIYKQGELPEKVLRAWQMLDEGKKTKNEDLIFKANVDILEHEQKVVIHPILYTGKRNETLWEMISRVDDVFRILVTSPVPEAPKTFGDVILNGNLAKIDQRWKWCTESIMPEWRIYEAKYPGKVKSLIKGVIA